MMPASHFAARSSSFWHSATPSSEGFVRRINRELYVREFPPHRSKIEAIRRGFINEIAFEAFALSTDKNPLRNGPRALNEPLLESALERSLIKAQIFKRREGFGSKELDRFEKDDVGSQFARLVKFFFDKGALEVLKVRPCFQGCGFIDRSEGDVFLGSTLFELKSGARGFRSSDLRQLLVYAALFMQEKGALISEVCLFNARMGISFTSDLETVSFEMSGKPARHLLAELIELFSADGVSR